nr:MAG TPA: hypothetical protein [Caudoviricetes sp.]
MCFSLNIEDCWEIDFKAFNLTCYITGISIKSLLRYYR